MQNLIQFIVRLNLQKSVGRKFVDTYFIIIWKLGFKVVSVNIQVQSLCIMTLDIRTRVGFNCPLCPRFSVCIMIRGFEDLLKCFTVQVAVFSSSSALSSSLLLLQPLGVFSIRCHPARDKVSQTNMQAGPLRKRPPHSQVL